MPSYSFGPGCGGPPLEADDASPQEADDAADDAADTEQKEHGLVTLVTVTHFSCRHE
jgi:hypothetical protein